MKYRNKVLAVLLVTVLTAVPLAACSKKAAPASAGDTNSGGQANASSQTRIVGKVTSVIGNQVVLAVGTLKNEGGFGGRSESSGSSGRAEKSKASSQNETASSGAQASGSSGSSSGSITLTGETKTLLIPVGLTITSGGTTARRSGGSTGSQTGSQAGSGSEGRSFGGTGETSGGSAGGSFSGFGGGSGGTSRSGGTGNSGSRNGGSAGGTSAGTAGSTLATLQRSQDFSSIKKGMVLQIVEETLSDGTQGITQVRIISQ